VISENFLKSPTFSVLANVDFGLLFREILRKHLYNISV